MRFLKVIFLALLLLFVAMPLLAQNNSVVDIGVGYSGVRSTVAGSEWFHGGAGQFVWHVWDRFGLVGDLGASHNGSPQINSTLVTGLGGVHASLVNTKHVEIFGEGLLGGARVGATFKELTAKTTQTSFALAMGGGMDVHLSQHFSLRLINAQYLETRFGSGVQNNLRVQAGLVIHLGSKGTN